MADAHRVRAAPGIKRDAAVLLRVGRGHVRRGEQQLVPAFEFRIEEMHRLPGDERPQRTLATTPEDRWIIRIDLADTVDQWRERELAHVRAKLAHDAIG